MSNALPAIVKESRNVGNARQRARFSESVAGSDRSGLVAEIGDGQARDTTRDTTRPRLAAAGVSQ